MPDGRLGANTQGHGVINPEKALLKALQTEGEMKPELIADDPLAALAEMGIDLGDLLGGGDEKPSEGEKA